MRVAENVFAQERDVTLDLGDRVQIAGRVIEIGVAPAIEPRVLAGA